MTPIAAGYRLVIKPDDLEEYTKGGIALVHSKYEDTAVQTGTILSIGDYAWRAFDTTESGKPCGLPWAKTGDRIVFSKYAARFFQYDEDSERVAFINDQDVIAVLPQEEVDSDGG